MVGMTTRPGQIGVTMTLKELYVSKEFNSYSTQSGVNTNYALINSRGEKPQ